jgi:hypothetical protein
VSVKESPPAGAADPLPEERTPADITEEERKRALRRLVRLLQVGGITFLVVVVLGLLPGALEKVSPELAAFTSKAIWVLAPILPIVLLVFAARRLRR